MCVCTDLGCSKFQQSIAPAKTTAGPAQKKAEPRTKRKRRQKTMKKTLQTGIHVYSYTSTVEKIVRKLIVKSFSGFQCDRKELALSLSLMLMSCEAVSQI